MQISHFFSTQFFHGFKDKLIESLSPQQKLICQIASTALVGVAAVYGLIFCYRKLKTAILNSTPHPTLSQQPLSSPLQPFTPSNEAERRQTYEPDFLQNPFPSLANNKAVNVWNKANELNKQGKPEEALVEIELALATDSRNLLLGIYGETLRVLGKLDQSIEVFHECLTLDPRNDYVLASYAQILHMQGKLDEAAAEFEKSLDINPTRLFAVTHYVKLLCNQDKNAEAAAVLRKYLENIPDDAEILSWLGDILRNQKKQFEAADVFEKVLSIDPTNRFALASYGDSLRMLYQFDKAAAVLKKHLELYPDNTFALSSYGDVLRFQKKFDESAHVLNHCLKLDPEDDFALGCLGQVHLDQGNIQEATRLFSEVLQLNDENTFALTGYGVLFRLEGKLAQSLVWLEKSVALDPDSETLGEYAETLRCLDRPEEALPHFEKALTDEPQKISWFLGAARCLCMLGRLPEARVKFQAVLDIEPSHKEALDGYNLCEDPNWGQAI